MAVQIVSRSVQLCTSEQQHGLRRQWCGLYDIHGQRYGLLLCTQRLCSCKMLVSMNLSFTVDDCMTSLYCKYCQISSHKSFAANNRFKQSHPASVHQLCCCAQNVYVAASGWSHWLLLHCQHLYGFSPSCTLRCFLVTLRLANALQHTRYFMVSLPCERACDTVEFQSM